MPPLPPKLHRGVASIVVGTISKHRTMVPVAPKGGDTGDGLPINHSRGGTDTSRFTSWTSTRSVAVHYARFSPTGKGVIREIDFAVRVAITHQYFQQADRFGEDEWLIEGIVRGVRVRPM